MNTAVGPAVPGTPDHPARVEPLLPAAPSFSGVTSRFVHGLRVRGVDVDPETRCAHYDTERDVIALRFGCCGEYYPCFECHDAVTAHEAEPWPRDRFDESAVLCGACGAELTVGGYRECGYACPECGAAFDPGCADHEDRYFEG